MTRHGKNCTAGAVYTYYEKKKDTGARKRASILGYSIYLCFTYPSISGHFTHIVHSQLTLQYIL
uniref:Nitric oxide synthase-interacting protein zinc-finger domain-containing protein n=1 Tax=Callorhinchus milii TaxID=7868 RepID=A0A4W3ICG4_CALMI